VNCKYKRSQDKLIKSPKEKLTESRTQVGRNKTQRVNLENYRWTWEVAHELLPNRLTDLFGEKAFREICKTFGLQIRGQTQQIKGCRYEGRYGQMEVAHPERRQNEGRYGRVLVMLVAVMALCYGESYNLT
jgi:hypothetical protein